MIKARPAAGDLALGARFLADLAPFIWRKYFDYAAIADIHAMKRQIHAVRGHEVRSPATTSSSAAAASARSSSSSRRSSSSSAAAGRRCAARARSTCCASLHAEHWIGADAVADLSAAYVFLREIEHRLQMIADEQTQRLPFETTPLARFASSAATRGSIASPPTSPALASGREPLRAAVRRRSHPRRRSRQPGLHRRRRRSGDADHAAPARLSASRGRRRDHPRLAFRPPRRRCAARAPAKS